jgi:hypothetical protein
LPGCTGQPKQARRTSSEYGGYKEDLRRRSYFDELAALSVEGLNKSAIARVKRIGWNTVDRWLQRAADSCRRFNDQQMNGIVISELRADEIRTILHDKEKPIWIFAAIEVWSRLWPSTVVGRQSCQSTVAFFRDISSRSSWLDFQETQLQRCIRGCVR